MSASSLERPTPKMVHRSTIINGNLTSFESYKKKTTFDQKYNGLSPLWKNLRISTINSRNSLVNEWMKRDIQGSQIKDLTNILVASMFEMNVEDYLLFKGLDKKDNLRDSMSEFELYYLKVAEEQAYLLHKYNKSHGFEEIKFDLIKAGQIVKAMMNEAKEKNNIDVTSSYDYKKFTKKGSK